MHKSPPFYSSPRALEMASQSSRQLTLLDVLDRILDKGVVITGDITLSFASVDLLSLKINLVIASLETAKRYGIELPWEKWEREKKALANAKQLPPATEKDQNP